MKIKINHETIYFYEDQVGLGIHKLYLSPQYQSFQRILETSLVIDPKPAGLGTRVDLLGNSFAQVWFDLPTNRLSISSELLIDCSQKSPFDFIIEPYFIHGFNELGFKKFTYQGDSNLLIQPFVHDQISGEMVEFVEEIRISSTTFLDFIVNLTARIHQDWDHLIREEEDFWAPAKTFSGACGSCRDLAWMQMNLLGALGLATRFVSGYAYNPELEAGHELHAWLEIYLPGAGWVGLDPSLGLLTNHLYVPLAFHAEPWQTFPVQGNYVGTAKSKLETEVTITLIDS